MHGAHASKIHREGTRVVCACVPISYLPRLWRTVIQRAEHNSLAKSLAVKIIVSIEVV